MANLPEQPLYEEGIYQIEEHDPVMAGPDGIDNLQSKQLANRTAWLKRELEILQASSGDIDAYTQAEVDAFIAGRLTQEQADNLYVPLTANPFVGFFFPFAGDTPPDGFLECNGAAISRTAYADLFAAIGNVWGDGDGSTTFNIPDMRGEFLRGWDNGRGVDNNRVVGSFQEATWIRNATYHGVYNSIGSVDGAKRSGSTQTYNGANAGHAYTDYYVRPRNISSLFCIKY